MRVLGAIVLDRKEQLMRLAVSVDQLPSLWLSSKRGREVHGRFQGKKKYPRGSIRTRWNGTMVRGIFARLLTKAGLAQRNLHFLRHTFASLLIQQGESLAYVKEQMAHSSIDITVDIYGHLVPGGNRQAVDKLDDASEIPDQFSLETKGKHFEKSGCGRESGIASI